MRDLEALKYLIMHLYRCTIIYIAFNYVHNFKIYTGT